jgi:hypothetical protein
LLEHSFHDTISLSFNYPFQSVNHIPTMRLFSILTLLLAGTSLAANVKVTSSRRTTSARATSAPAAKIATPRVLSPANPPIVNDVKNSITNWATSVKTVNDYLNNPSNTTKLQSAIVFAKDEPVQLATLMKVKGLSADGVNAGKVLMGNFPSIVSNLNSVQSGVMTTQDATAAVNFNRCCAVLPAIGSLWAASANATKAGAVNVPDLEAQCSQTSCASGVSGGNSTGAKLVMM